MTATRTVTVAATLMLAIALMLTMLAARAVAADDERLDDCAEAPTKAAEQYCLTHNGAAPPAKPARLSFKPWQRIWQCNDIRVTETVNQPGIVNYDLGGTIWGGSNFTLNFQRGELYFNGRPCLQLR